MILKDLKNYFKGGFMNIYELNKLIIQLESENKSSNNELIEFYKIKKIELIGKINSELKKNINKFFKEVK
tara:strand:+ start:395 stop:604 length:210 start_codon:yes stop_codon:yes gene_type:complete